MKKKSPLHITYNYFKNCNALQLITITITSCNQLNYHYVHVLNEKKNLHYTLHTITLKIVMHYN